MNPEPIHRPSRYNFSGDTRHAETSIISNGYDLFQPGRCQFPPSARSLAIHCRYELLRTSVTVGIQCSMRGR